MKLFGISFIVLAIAWRLVRGWNVGICMAGGSVLSVDRCHN